MFCPYRHVFGEERKGFHSFRIFDIAVGDLLLTILLAFSVSKAYNTNFFTTLFITLVIAVFIHRLFCVNTKINTIIFGKV